MVNEPISSAGSATRTSSDAKSKDQDKVIAIHDDHDEAEAGSSTNRLLQSLLERRDRPPENEEVDSIVHSNAAHDETSTHSSAWDNSSTSATSVDCSSISDDGAAADSPVEGLNGSLTRVDTPEPQSGNLNGESVIPPSTSNQPNPGQPRHNLGTRSLSGKDKELTNNSKNPGLGMSRFGKLKGWVQKAGFDKEKNKSQRGRTRTYGLR